MTSILTWSENVLCKSCRSSNDLSNAVCRLLLRCVFFRYEGAEKAPPAQNRTFQSPPGIGLSRSLLGGVGQPRFLLIVLKPLVLPGRFWRTLATNVLSTYLVHRFKLQHGHIFNLKLNFQNKHRWICPCLDPSWLVPHHSAIFILYQIKGRIKAFL